MTKALTPEKLARHFSRADDERGSNYEDMVRVMPLTHASVDCRACSGKGYKELSEQELRKFAAQIARQETIAHRDQVRAAMSRASDCDKCHGTGKVSAPRGDRSAAMDSMFTTVRCALCRGGAEVTRPTDTSAERQDVCLACGGDAYIVPVTVRCRGSSNQGGAGGGSATDHDGSSPLMLPAAPQELTSGPEAIGAERVELAAQIEAMRTRDPQLAAALARYHGPESEPWVEHRWGRAFVVWQDTAPGKQLAELVAERSPARSGYLVAPIERIRGAREAVERPGVARPTADHQLMRVLVAKADREAREILRRLKSLVHPLGNVNAA